MGWLTFAKAAGFVFSLALPLLVVRRMNPDQVGIYKQVFLIVTTAMSILPLGVHMSAYYFLPRESDRRQQTVLNIMLFLTTVGALGCCVLVFYPQVLTVVFYQQGLTQYSRLIGLTLLLWILGTFLENVPIANEEIRLATVLIIASQATRAMVFLAAVSIWGTVQALILAAIIHGLIQTGVLCWYLESRFPGFWHSFDWPMLRRQMSYAVPLGTAATLFALQTDLHNYFVSHSFPPAIFAIYSYGTLQLPLMGLIGEAVNSVLITRVSVLQQENKNREIIRLIVRAGRKLAVVYFAAYALLLVVGPELIKLLFTNRYAESWPVFAVNLTLLPLNILMLDAIFRAYASQRFFFPLASPGNYFGAGLCSFALDKTARLGGCHQCGCSHRGYRARGDGRSFRAPIGCPSRRFLSVAGYRQTRLGRLGDGNRLPCCSFAACWQHSLPDPCRVRCGIHDRLLNVDLFTADSSRQGI